MLNLRLCPDVFHSRIVGNQALCCFWTFEASEHLFVLHLFDSAQIAALTLHYVLCVFFTAHIDHLLVKPQLQEVRLSKELE